MFGALNLGPLLEAVKEITGFVAMITTTYTDVLMHVVFTVLSELAIMIWNSLQIAIRAVASVVMTLVSSGALQTILKTGLDLLMTLVVYVALPALMAILDLFMCMPAAPRAPPAVCARPIADAAVPCRSLPGIMNFIQPDTWAKQLSCVKSICFQADGDVGGRRRATPPPPPAARSL